MELYNPPQREQVMGYWNNHLLDDVRDVMSSKKAELLVNFYLGDRVDGETSVVHLVQIYRKPIEKARPEIRAFNYSLCYMLSLNMDDLYIIRLLSLGQKVKQVANLLGSSEQVIKNRLSKLYEINSIGDKKDLRFKESNQKQILLSRVKNVGLLNSYIFDELNEVNQAMQNNNLNYTQKYDIKWEEFV
jgi:hypothetical protein